MDSPTLSQIQNQLNAKSEQIESLRNDLAQVKQKIVVMEKQLAELVGEIRFDPSQPLRQFVAKVLSETNEPLTVSQIAELVREAGYNSKAPEVNFKSMVQAVLTKGDDFRRVTKANARPARYAIE
jgi:septal ring factor EnvC (AmiA/AmiB activator)